MTSKPLRYERYTHGHAPATVRQHAQRTADEAAAFLLPGLHWQGGLGALLVAGCVTGRGAAALARAQRMYDAGRYADAVVAADGVSAADVPSEMVTASGSGMDPHIPPRAAEIQIARVARARQVDAEKVRALVAAHTLEPALGVFGRSRVNVLELNLALDDSFGASSRAAK